MRKSTIAIGIAAALSTQAFVSTPNADAAVKGKPSTGTKPVTSQNHFKFPNHVRPTGSTVLYDQTNSSYVNGAPAQNFESSFDAYDNWAADDFVVTDAAGWSVSAFNFAVTFRIGVPDTGITYNVDVYADAAGVPGGSPVCSASAVTGTLDGTNTSLSITMPSACSLAAGTYWVSLQANMDFSTDNNQMYFSDWSPGTVPNSDSKWENPGDGFATGCTTWSSLATCVSTSTTQPVGGGNTAFGFQVIGAVGGGGTCGAGALCLETTVGTDTSAGACATTDTLDVTVGDQVNFCYVITNNTGVELDYHTLSDNLHGTIFNLLNQAVPAGGTFQYNRIETAGSTETVNSSWTGQDVPPGYSATVTGGGGGCDRIFADGFDGTTVPCNSGGGFIDISGTGTALGLGDDSSADVSMPFSFNFYGTTSSDITVSNNGAILFGTTGGLGVNYLTATLPSSTLAGPAILPMWDDFDSESGDVYYDTRGTTPNRQFIVEWFNRVHYTGSSNTDGATFEVILNESDGTLQFEYSDVEYTANGSAGGTDPTDCTGGICATIGLQSTTALFNQFSAFEASVTDNSGILWEPTSPQSFTGTDTATVNVGAPQIVINPSPITGTVPEGGNSTIPFAVENHGNRDLNWSLDEAGPANIHFPPPGTRFAMPLGDPALASAGRAPNLHRPHKEGRHAMHVPFGTGTIAFAADAYNDQFQTFDVLNPGTVNNISSGGGTAYGLDFVDADFSKAYGVDKFGSTTNAFSTIDTATGAVTNIGTAVASADGGAGWSGFKYDTSTGNLYGAGTTCGSSSHLYTIDITTGNASLVGEITGGACIVAIAIDPNGLMYGLDIVSDSLYAIDKTTGNASLIGSIGFDANFGQDMEFDDATGILYYAGFDGGSFTDSMYTLDVTTGQATLIGPIGPSLEQVVGLAIETAGGPCAQPQDLPWLSLSPTSGTTAAAGSTPVSASIDGTGSTEGDILAGTVCATSNDPANHHLATPINVTVGPAGGGGNIVDSGVLDDAIVNDTNGLYINWLTGATCSTASGGGCNVSQAWDFNPYGTSLTFYWGGSIADTSFCVWDGTACTPLASGATIGPASSFGSGSATLFQAGGTLYMGFSFMNTNTATVNYGYAKLTTTGATGFPATLNEYWYDNSGAAITIP